MHSAWAWGLLAVFLVHNAEEALTMGDYLAGADPLERLLGIDPSRLLVPFLAAVTAVSLAALVLVVAATRRAARPWALEGLRILAWVMVINVVLPHVPATVLQGSYVPGVVTAVLLSLPVGIAFLRVHPRAVRPGPAAATLR